MRRAASGPRRPIFAGTGGKPAGTILRTYIHLAYAEIDESYHTPGRASGGITACSLVGIHIVATRAGLFEW